MCRTWVESISGSYAGRIAPPGMPNTVSTPAASSERTRLLAPLIVVVGGVCDVDIVGPLLSVRVFGGDPASAVLVQMKDPVARRLTRSRRSREQSGWGSHPGVSRYYDNSHALIVAPGEQKRNPLAQMSTM